MATRLTIWIGEETDAVRERVAAIQATVPEDDGYMHLSEQDFGDFNMREGWSKYLETIGARVVSAPTPYPFTVNMAKADLLRLVVAASVPDAIYTDLDVTIKKPLAFEKGGPFFAQIGEGLRVDHCFFAVNGGCAYFERLLDNLATKAVVTRKTLFGLINQKAAGEFHVIPSDCFTHEGAAKWQR